MVLGVEKTFFFRTWSCGILNERGWSVKQDTGKFFILGSNC